MQWFRTETQFDIEAKKDNSKMAYSIYYLSLDLDVISLVSSPLTM